MLVRIGWLVITICGEMGKSWSLGLWQNRLVLCSCLVVRGGYHAISIDAQGFSSYALYISFSKGPIAPFWMGQRLQYQMYTQTEPTQRFVFRRMPRIALCSSFALFRAALSVMSSARKDDWGYCHIRGRCIVFVVLDHDDQHVLRWTHYGGLMEASELEWSLYVGQSHLPQSFALKKLLSIEPMNAHTIKDRGKRTDILQHSISKCRASWLDLRITSSPGVVYLSLYGLPVATHK